MSLAHKQANQYENILITFSTKLYSSDSGGLQGSAATFIGLLQVADKMGQVRLHLLYLLLAS